ncbi:MAG: 30S ribosomal protein S10 [Planctomycetes bacterium]|nr:30S ribosomal protein S10 [Planctomycetota bacterium]
MANVPASNKQQRIKIRMDAYDHELLDASVRAIVEASKQQGARVAGPIPLPTRIERITVNRSPHVDKKSREQFEIRTHKRVLYILDPSSRLMQGLNDRISSMPAGVEMTIKFGE